MGNACGSVLATVSGDTFSFYAAVYSQVTHPLVANRPFPSDKTRTPAMKGTYG